MKIRETGKVIVRGECILSYNDFEKIKESENPESVLTINDSNTPQNTESLASKLGVGGTQALTAIMEGMLPENQKRGLLAVLFGLSEDEINTLFDKVKV